MSLYHIEPKDIRALRNERLRTLRIIEVTEGEYFSERGTPGYKSLLENAYSDRPRTTIATEPINILEIAWSELLFAEIFNMPVSLCTYCGTPYRLDEKNKRANYRRNNCGGKECKHIARKLMDNRGNVTKTKALQLIGKGVGIKNM
nr:hypothetical protein [Neobacillus sp. Marseille-Q6967]